MNLMDVLIVTLFVVVAGCGFFFGVARTISTMIA